MNTSLPRLPEPETIHHKDLASRLRSENEQRREAWLNGRLVTPFRVYFDEPLVLECGEVLPEFTLQVETYGDYTLKDKHAVLVCHALTGNAHLAGKNHESEKKSGWWNDITGPNLGLNTDTHFIVCSHVPGGCNGSTGPDSINPKTGSPYLTDFPDIHISDMVKAQHRLMQALEIDSWQAVMGGSMGGFQALEWGFRYPDCAKKIIALACATRYSTQGIAFNAVGRHAILNDPQWRNGNYALEGCNPAKGLATARMLAHITYVSEDSLDRKFGRQLIEEQSVPRAKQGDDSPFNPAFQVESYLDYQGLQFVKRFDANSYLYLSKALDTYDPVSVYGEGNPEKLWESWKAELLLISYSSDWLFPPKEMQNMMRGLLKENKSVRYINLTTPHGHDAFLLETDSLNQLFKAFLAPGPEEAASFDQHRQQPQEAHEPQIREDLKPVLGLIQSHESVLDLGAGRAELLRELLRQKPDRRVTGIEKEEEKIIEGLSKNLPLIQADILDTLNRFPSKSYDVAVLHLALQSLQEPVAVLKEMKRVAKRTIVGFPNFGFFNVRLQLLLKGRMPTSEALPYMWYNTPNIHLFTLCDFEELIKELGFYAGTRYYRIQNRWKVKEADAFLANWRASHAIFELLPACD